MNNGPISIDNVQGLLTIDQPNGSHKLLLNNVENGLVYINAPNSDVILTLKGLHDSSYINCRNLQIVVSDEFFQSNIMEYNKGGALISHLDDFEEIEEMGEHKPTLYF